METKVSAFPLKELDEKGLGVAVIATKNVVDKDGDVTLDGAFGEQVVPVMPAHDWRQAPLGKAKLSETATEVEAQFRLNLKTTLGRDWYEALKFDLENPPAKAQWSYGFSALDAEPGAKDGQRVRFLKRLQVHEVSGVLLGASIGTRTVALKADRWLTAEQVERLCPPCAEKMRAMGFKKITLAALVKQGGFTCPKPFDSFEACVERFSGEPDIGDPEAFCAEWERFCEGKQDGCGHWTETDGGRLCVDGPSEAGDCECEPVEAPKGLTMDQDIAGAVQRIERVILRLEQLSEVKAKTGRTLSFIRKEQLERLRLLSGQLKGLGEAPKPEDVVREFFALRERMFKGLDVS